MAQTIPANASESYTRRMSFRSYASFRAKTPPPADDFRSDLACRIVTGFRRRGVTCTDAHRVGEATRAQIQLDDSELLLVVTELDTVGHHNWLVHIEPPRTGRLLRRRGAPSPVQKVQSTQVLHEILTEDLDVRPHWFSAEEWRDPRCEVGVTVPA